MTSSVKVKPLRKTAKLWTCLVIHADMDVFLSWWENFAFFRALKIRQLLASLLNNLQRSLDLVLGNDKRRCQTDDVLMRGFRLGTLVSVRFSCTNISIAQRRVFDMSDLQRPTYQQSLLLHQHAQVPRAVATSLALVNHDRVQQSLSTDRRDHAIPSPDVFQSSAEDLAQMLGSLHQAFLFDDFKGFDRHRAAERIAAVRGAVSARLHDHHHLLRAQDARDRVHAA